MNAITIQREQLEALSHIDLIALNWQLDWRLTARPNQLAPAGDEWDFWGAMAGRGFGKTRLGAQWLAEQAWNDPEALPRAVIAPTQADVRFVCYEGPAGLINIIPPELVAKYNSTDLIITLVNGAEIRGFSAEKSDRLRGPQHADIWCFVAGTQVAVQGGELPIERVTEGMLVFTRSGLRPVVANAERAAEVGEVVFSNGAKLVGTADHPVYTDLGWMRLDQLKEDDQVCALSVLSGVENGGIDTATAIMSAPTSLSNRSELSGSIARCGRLLTALYQRATTFTTAMRIKVTTTSLISSACRVAPTGPTTSPRRLYLGGTGARFRQSSWPVQVAGSPSHAKPEQQAPSVLHAPRDALTESDVSRGAASTAARGSCPGPETSAVSVVSTWRPLGRQSVYCLKVADEPEYFANGILVHNCDEIAAWPKAEATWDMAMFGLRLGNHPRAAWTTTPKPVPIIARLVKAERTVITKGKTSDNKANLAPTFFRQLKQYEGTTLGRQELDGELIDPKEAGVIRQSWLRLWPAEKRLPEFQWIIMSLDTAFTEATITKGVDGLMAADPTACSVWGVFHHEKRSNALLLDCWQEHLGFPDLIKRVKRELNTHYGDDQDKALIAPMFGSDKPLTSGRKPDMLILEDKGSGISLRQALTRDGIYAYAYNPGRADKLSRLHMVSPVFARRQVWVPESAKLPGQPRTWAMPLIDQLCSYSGPGTTKHDDFVDTVSQCFRVLLDKTIMSTVRKPTEGKEPVVPPPPEYRNPYAA